MVEGKESVSIKIVKLGWDHDIQKSDEELRRIGRESQTISQWMVEPEAVVSTLEQLATEGG